MTNVERKIAVIACIDNAGGFAKEQKIPWLDNPVSKIDLKHFKETTKDSIIIMGRNTYNEIAGLRTIKTNILPDRQSYVITSDINNECAGAITIGSIQEVIDSTDKDIFIIGGYQLFVEGLELGNTCYLSCINQSYDCDQFFPGTPLNDWTYEYTNSEHIDLIFAKYTKV